MKILALDTSTQYCSAALWLDGELRVDGCHAEQRHSQLILPMIDALLVQSGNKLAEFDAVAFGEGPGSFTGLRIACGVAQGLALGSGLPVIGIGTLLAIAEASQGTHALCCLDARMGEVYAAAYRLAEGRWETVFEPGVYSPAALPRLPAGDWIGCGPGFAAYTKVLGETYGTSIVDVRSDLLPHAREIAGLAAEELTRGGAKRPEEALPLYIRDRVALTLEEQR